MMPRSGAINAFKGLISLVDSNAFHHAPDETDEIKTQRKPIKPLSQTEFQVAGVRFFRLLAEKFCVMPKRCAGLFATPATGVTWQTNTHQTMSFPQRPWYLPYFCASFSDQTRLP